MEIVLASASPRRRELLSLITEHFTVCPADADETLRDAPLGEEVTRLSRLKAEQLLCGFFLFEDHAGSLHSKYCWRVKKYAAA